MGRKILCGQAGAPFLLQLITRALIQDNERSIALLHYGLARSKSFEAYLDTLLCVTPLGRVTTSAL